MPQTARKTSNIYYILEGVLLVLRRVLTGQETSNMTKETQYMEPMVHDSGRGGNGLGTGELPVQSKQEQVPLVF
jgi:hypothetical protein